MPNQTYSVRRTTSPLFQPKRAVSLEREEGRDKCLSQGYNSCFSGCCAFILLSHLLITKLPTSERDAAASPATILGTFTGDQAATLAGPWQHHLLQERENVTAQQQQSTHVCFPRRTLVEKPFVCSVFKTQKVKFQWTCGPEGLSNRSLFHQSSLPPTMYSSVMSEGYPEWLRQGRGSLEINS